MRLRLKVTRTGRLRYISHLDFVRMMERAVRSAGIGIAYSAGYNPRPKLAYSPALAVGTSSETEFVDMWLTHSRDPRVIVKQLNESLPTGAHIIGARKVADRAKALTAVITDAEYEVELPLLKESGEIVTRLRDRVDNARDTQHVSIANIDQNMVIIRMVVPAGSRQGPKPGDVVAELIDGLIDPDQVANRIRIHRRRLFVGGDKGPPRPLDV